MWDLANSARGPQSDNRTSRDLATRIVSPAFHAERVSRCPGKHEAMILLIIVLGQFYRLIVVPQICIRFGMPAGMPTPDLRGQWSRPTDNSLAGWDCTRR
jgi:hypothetical protein